MDKSLIQRLVPFLLLSVLLHGMLLFGIRINILNSAKPMPVLSVLLQAAPIGSNRTTREALAGSGLERSPSPNIIALPSNHDLAREALALAGRFAYEDSQIEGKEPKIPAAWVGAYEGTYSGGKQIFEINGIGLGGDYGKIRLNITETGEVSHCSIVSNTLSTLGKIPCSGSIDKSGNLSFGVLDSDLFEARCDGVVTADATLSHFHFSGTWEAIHFPSGKTFKGQFRMSKITIQGLGD